MLGLGVTWFWVLDLLGLCGSHTGLGGLCRALLGYVGNVGFMRLFIGALLLPLNPKFVDVHLPKQTATSFARGVPF